MQISGAVAISLAIPRIRGCGDQPWEGGWTLLCQREGFVGARPNPASVAGLSQFPALLFPTAVPLFKAHPRGQACDFLPSWSLCAGLLHVPRFWVPLLPLQLLALCLSQYLPSHIPVCAVAGGMKPREQGHHLNASTWRHQLPQEPRPDVGWGRWMQRERGRKKGLCMKYSKWGKLAGLLML